MPRWIQYKGYTIELASHPAQQHEGGPWGWVARAIVAWDQPDGVHRQPLSDPKSRLFETLEEANRPSNSRALGLTSVTETMAPAIWPNAAASTPRVLRRVAGG